jgi:hypothetical protein
MPQIPRLAIGAAGSALPATQHVADLTIKLNEPGMQIFCRARQRLRNPVHRLGVNPYHRVISHGGKRNHQPRPPQFTRPARALQFSCDTGAMIRPQVQLLTRAGCTICDQAHLQLKDLAADLDFDLSTTDVDEAAANGDSSLRAEFGDRLPVVLLDGREHSYWEVDEPRLRKDLHRPR